MITPDDSWLLVFVQPLKANLKKEQKSELFSDVEVHFQTIQRPLYSRVIKEN